MRKILIIVYVPASNKQYEMLVPRNMQVANMEKMIIDYLSRMPDSGFIPNEETAICSFPKGEPLDRNLFVEELGLLNGDRLIVI